VRSICIALIFAGVLTWGADPRTEFEKLKAEGRAAIQASDWKTAEARFSKVLQLSDIVHPGTYEMYAEVVSPLADVYRKTGATEKLEALYQMRSDRATEGLAKGLAQADLGFFYQASDFASADQYHGEQLVEAAVKSFEDCTLNNKLEGEQCRRRLADTAGIQGAMFFQRHDYGRAEPLFRRVISSPETMVQDEVMLVSLHALRGILITRKDFEGAKQLELRAAAYEAAHPNALDRLKAEGTRSRSQ
jgi:hypothetical protein